MDHFHVVQLANRTVNLVRRRVTASLRGRRVRTSDAEYRIRRRLLRNREDLTDAKFADMWNRLIDLAAPGEEILTAWIAKEELRALLALGRTHPTRHQISHRLWDFYRWCADSDIPELAVLVGFPATEWPCGARRGARRADDRRRDEDPDIEDNGVVKAARRILPVTDKYRAR